MVARQKNTLLCFFADLCLTLFALVGTIFCVITSFKIDVNNLVLIFICVLSSLCFTLLFNISNLYIRWGLASASIVTFAVFGYFERHFLITGGKTSISWVLVRFARFIEEIKPYYTSDELRSGINGKETMLFLVFFAVVLAFVYAFIISRTKTVFPVFVISIPFFSACMFIVNTTPDMIPFVMITTFWIILLFVGFLRKSNRNHSAKVTLIMTPFVAALLTVIVIINPAESYKRYEPVNDLNKNILKWLDISLKPKAPSDIETSDVSSGEDNSGENSGPSSDESGNGENSGEDRISENAYENPVDLSNLHSIKFNDKTIIKLHTVYNKNFLLRAYSSGEYIDNRWLPPSEEYTAAVEALMKKYADIKEASPLEFPAAAIRHSADYYDSFWASINCYDLTNPLVFTPPNFLGDESYLPSDAYYQFPENKIRTSYGYVIDYYTYKGKWSSLSLPDRLAEYENEYRKLVYRYFLQVPVSSYDTVRDTLRQIGIKDSMSFEEKVFAIEQFVENHGKYSLNINILPQGKDFVSYFLSESRTGFCMHFASAAVLLYRQAGIPARYVTGFYVDRSNMDRSGNIILTDRQAHAWVEVYLDGVGWLPVNVTPGFPTGGSSFDPSENSTDDSSAEDDSNNDSSGDETSEESSRDETEDTSDESPVIPVNPPEGDKGSRTLIHIIIALALIASAAVIRRHVMIMVRNRQFAVNSNNKSVINMWKYIITLTRSSRPDETVYAIAQKARFSQHIVNDKEKTAIRDYALALAKDTYKKKNFFGRFAMKYIYATI